MIKRQKLTQNNTTNKLEIKSINTNTHIPVSDFTFRNHSSSIFVREMEQRRRDIMKRYKILT
jgi:DNA-binding transcriptional regulator YiaG